tara:strand:- start:30703 stop:31458 length:756 start_codon:yes stop_codon:yes gene_type:complete
MGELINLQQNTNLGINLESKQLTMNSQEISEILQSRHDSVKRAMLRLEEKGLIQLSPMVGVNHKGQSVKSYDVNKRDSYVVVAQLSPEFTALLVDRWQELENQSKPQMTQMEIIAHNAMALVEQEKRINQVVHNQALLEDKFEQLKESTAILPKRPTNAEGITFVRARMHKLYKLPPRVVNEVLYSSPYAPKPAGQVRNTHEQAGNATYTVWYTSDVSKLFTRFVEECEFVTKTQAVHPDIDGRFKLVMES